MFKIIKKNILILISFIMLFQLAGCVQKQEELIIDEPEGEIADLSSCSFLEKNSDIDINLNGCLYSQAPSDDYISAQIYLPSLENPYKVTKQKTYILSKNNSSEYFIKVLSSFFDPMKKYELFTLSHSDNTITIKISDTYAKIFASTYNLPTDKKEIDTNGIIQVISTCFADTIYTNCPEIENVTFDFPLSQNIPSITDGIYIDKTTLLPRYVGSKNNYVGDFSYSDFYSLAETEIDLSEDELIKINYLVTSYVDSLKFNATDITEEE